ncbi:MAG: hypothetical protein U0744_10205 [Gemmataceae bacterium]
MSPEQFASARIHALFREVHERSDWGLLAAKTSKRELGLTSFDRIPTPEEEAKFYGYLTTDSGLANQIVGLFGISHRCWHGCGYLGWPTFPLCRFFLLRNLISAGMQVRIMMGSERFLYDPRAEVAGAV